MKYTQYSKNTPMIDKNPINQNQQLADYIKKNISKGYTIESLKYSLMQQGYSRTSVEKGMELATKQMAINAPKMVEKPIITYRAIDEEELKQKIAENEGKGFFKKLFSWGKK